MFADLISATYLVKNNILYNDFGIFTTSLSKEYFTNVIDINIKKPRRGGLYLEISYDGGFATIITRRYQKFPEMVANVTAMLSFVKLAFYLLNILISDYLFFKYFVRQFLRKTDINTLEVYNKYKENNGKNKY